MKVAFKIMLLVCFFSTFAYADEMLREFSFKTVGGTTIEYKATNKMPMVVNIGAHW